MMYVHSRRNYTRKSTWEFTLIFYNQTHKNIHLNINTYYTHTHTHTHTHSHTHEECSWPFAWFCTVRNQRKNLALCKHKRIFVFRQEMPRKRGKSFKNLQKSWKICRPHLFYRNHKTYNMDFDQLKMDNQDQKHSCIDVQRWNV